MSKILANEIANYGDNAPIDLKEGLNIPAGKPIQAAGLSGTSGQVLSSTGTSINWITPFDGDYTSLTNRPTIPAAQVNSDWNATSGVAVILNKPTVPPLTSLVVNSAGTPSLTFNGANGQFTYTPPDLSNYDTAFGWGDHASAGYVTTSGTQTISGAKTFSASTTFSENVDFEGNPNGGAALSMQFYKGNGTNSDLDTLKFFNRSGITIGAGETGGFTMRSWNSNSSYILTSGDSFFIDGGTSTAIKIRTQFARNAIVCNSDNGGTGTVELYHSASGTATKKLETTSAGASVYGQLTADGITLNGTLDLGSNDLTTTGKLYYSNNFADLTALQAVSASTYHGMFAHVHAEGHGYFGHAGGWIQLLDTGSSIAELADVDLSTPPSTGQVLKYDGNNWVAGPDNAGSGGTGIALTDISVTTASAGTAALSYNNVSGVFTYTPPNLSGYLTTETDPVYSASPAAGILSSNISNWDTAYGWGNHASAGYLTSETSHADVVVDGDFTSSGLMKRGASSGTYSIVTDNSNNWNTAYGWGNHASAGYLTSYTVTASDLSGISVNALSDVNTAGASVNDVLKWNGSAWTAQADATGGGGGGGANVTISDTAPGGASAGDLWWESDKGRLKIYYQDVDTTQWVDASPPLAPTGMSNGNSSISITDTGSNGTINFNTEGNDRWEITNAGHLLPKDHETYDIGSADQKVRHLFLSDNSLWLGNRTRMSLGFRNNSDAFIGARPTVRFYNRDVNKTPKPIADAGGTVNGCIAWVNSTFPGRSGAVNASTLLLTDWTGYWSSLTGAPIGTYGVDDLYPPQYLDGDINPAYFGADWADIMGFGQNGQERAVTVTSDSGVYDLADTDTFIRVNANADFPVNIGSVSTDNDTFFNMTVWVSQGVTPYAINAVSLDNGSGGFTAATQVKSKGTALANNVQAFKITGVKISGNWSVNIDIG